MGSDWKHVNVVCCICVCVCVCVIVCVLVYIQVLVRTFVYVHICMYECIRMCACMCVLCNNCFITLSIDYHDHFIMIQYIVYCDSTDNSKMY